MRKQKPNFTIEILAEIMGILIMIIGILSLSTKAVNLSEGIVIILFGALVYFLNRSMEMEDGRK